MIKNCIIRDQTMIDDVWRKYVNMLMTEDIKYAITTELVRAIISSYVPCSNRIYILEIRENVQKLDFQCIECNLCDNIIVLVNGKECEVPVSFLNEDDTVNIWGEYYKVAYIWKIH